MKPIISRLVNSAPVNFAALFTFTLLLRGYPVPWTSEWLYLVLPWREVHPEILRQDWTMAWGFPEHWFYNVLATIPMRFLSIDAVAWGGRALGAALVLWGLFRLGRWYALPVWATSAAILLWLVTGQNVANVGAEWMLATFEAKTFAYAALLAALDRFRLGSYAMCGLLLGLAFSIHPAVGLSGGVGFLGAFLVLRPPLRAWAAMAGCGLVASLPGVVPLLSSMFGAHGAVEVATNETWKYVTTVSQPQHLDPRIFNRTGMGLLVVLLAFNILQWRGSAARRQLSPLLGFEVALAGWFGLGMVFAAMGWYAPLQFMPFRLFPVFAPLFFFMALLALATDRSAAPKPALVAVAAAALLLFAPPTTFAVDSIATTLRGKAPDDDYAKAFRWLQASTPVDAQTMLPPWRGDSWLLAQRAQVVTFHTPPWGRLVAWQQRLTDVFGTLDRRLADGDYQARYRSMPADTLQALRSRYPFDYLVSEGEYPYPILYQSGAVKVFRMPEAAAP